MRIRVIMLAALFFAAVVAGPAAHAQRGAAPSVAETDPPVADIRTRAEAGEAQAQYDLAQFYIWGIRGVPCDRRAALPWLEKAAGQGHKYAVDRLAMEREDLATYERLRAAALTGNAQAQYEFGRNLSHLRCFGEDWRTNKTWLMRAVRQGNGDAMAWFGDYYAYGYKYYLDFPKTKAGDYPAYAGNLGARNLPTAVAWYRRAAAAGSASGYYMLPVVYGMDSPLKDMKAMEEWLVRDAYRPLNRGEDPDGWPRLRAWRDLCNWYDRGFFGRDSNVGYPFYPVVEGARRPVEALTCYRNARASVQATGGASLFQDQIYRLAQLYELGRGTPRDAVAAEALYREVLALDPRELEPPLASLSAMRLGLLLQARGETAEAYRWLARTPDDKSCPADDYLREDPLLLCHRARAARDAIGAHLPADEKARLDRAAST